MLMMMFSRVHTLINDKKIASLSRLSKMRYTSSTGNVRKDEAMLMDTDICFLYVVMHFFMKYIFFLSVSCVINFPRLCNFMLT